MLLCFSFFAQCKEIEKSNLKVLILGGTTFLGPHLTNELLRHGHKVTHFNRGNDNGFSFPDVEKLHGNRDGNLKTLEGRKWDAVIDTSGYLPRIVEASSKLLAKATNHYTFVSTIRVYDNFNQLNINEDFSLAKLDDTADEKITEKTYGPFKVGCEKVIKNYFPNNSLIIRPGIIVGPYDPTDRFTHWVRRIAAGGKVLIPKEAHKQKLQIIDVRDLAKWIVKMVEGQTTGTYNATGPKEKLNFEELIHECSKFAKKQIDFIYVDEKVLIEHHISIDWNKFPLLFPSKSNMVGLFSINCQRAQNKGLSYRPLATTIADTLKWDRIRIKHKMNTGLNGKEEKNILTRLFK
jgi:2'-hydroxyisoflavone reductase